MCAKDECKILNDDIILNLFINKRNAIDGNKTGLKYLNKHTDIKNYLINRYQDNIENISFHDIIYRIWKKIDTWPTCKTCGKPLNNIYKEHCNYSCAAKDTQVQQKLEQTCMIKYNTKRYSSTEEYRNRENRFNTNPEKQKQTRLENLDKDPEYYKKIWDKAKITIQQNIKNNPQYEELKEQRRKDTCFRKYGYNYSLQSPEIRNNIKVTNNKLYGCDWYLETEVARKALENSSIQKYGVSHHTQSEEWKRNNNCKYYYNKLNFDSSWELSFYIWHKDNNIEIKREPCHIIYYIESKKHTYIPDFLIGNVLIEIKSPSAINENGILLDITKYPNIPLPEKTRCLRDNDVKIITDCSFYLNYIKEKYGRKYLTQFKVKRRK